MPIDKETLALLQTSNGEIVELDLNADSLAQRSAIVCADVQELVSIINKHNVWVKLWLDSHELGDEAAQALASCKTLLKLSLSYNDISDAGAAFLLNNPNLIDLDISNNKVTNETLRLVAKNNSLLELSIHGNCIDNQGVKYILQNTSLRCCTFSQKPAIDRDLAAQVYQHLQHNEDRLKHSRNQFVVTVLLLALHHYHNNPALMCQLPVETLVHLCGYLNFPSIDYGWHRAGESCATFVFYHIAQYKDRLNVTDSSANLTMSIETKGTMPTLPSSFRFFYNHAPNNEKRSLDNDSTTHYPSTKKTRIKD